ncbi:MAG: type II secretion system protein GspJ [Limisphaerales bacterium]
MNTNRSVDSRKAFTLLEVLIAIAVSAIVLAAINMVFYSALHLRNRTMASLDESTPVDHALAIIRRDLANIVAPSLTNYPLQSTIISQSQFGQITPDLYTATGQIDGLVPWGDVQKISYGLVPSADGTSRDLIRLVSHNLLATTTEMPEQQWLLGGVKNIALHYFDGAQWADVWDTTTQSNLPTAVKVDLDLANTMMHMVVALDTQVRTNQ